MLPSRKAQEPCHDRRWSSTQQALLRTEDATQLAAEYTALRQEIVEWQGRRFTAASAVIVVVTLVLGWLIQNPHKWSWANAATLLVGLLGAGCYLTWMFRMLTDKIGAYLVVFHDSAWERRTRAFRDESTRVDMNFGFALVYVVLALIAVVIPVTVSTRPATTAQEVVFAFVATAATLAFLRLVIPMRRGSRAIDLWREIRDAES